MVMTKPARMLHRPEGRLIAAILGAIGLMGCNMITGADEILIQNAMNDDGGADVSSSGSGLAGTTGPGSPTSGSATTSGVGGSDGLPEAQMVGAPGVNVTRIVLNQAVSRELMIDGQASSSSVPVLAGRKGLVRVFYGTDPSYDGQAVTARLRFEGGEVIEKLVDLSSTVSESALSSTINFELGPEHIVAGGAYRIDLLQPREDASLDHSSARFPTDSSAMQVHGAQSAPKLTLMIVPIKYNGDGSGRLPDTSNAQIQKLAERFYAMYPVREVDVKIRSSINWSQKASSGGNGWGNLLNAIADLRSNDGAEFNTYYFGMFNPASTRSAYCGGGCVAGLGFLGSPGAPMTRAAIGLGFGDDMAIHTALHEVGHNHGREHAPCGNPANVDPSYPYGGGSIGVYGYDLITTQHYAPSGFKDVMSYCQPSWISDHNFARNYQHASMLGGAQVVVPPALMNRSYERVVLDGKGSGAWIDPIVLEHPPLAEAIDVTVETTQGPEIVTGELLRYDHLPGGVLYLPPTAAPFAASTKSIQAQIDGNPVIVARAK